jgi:hypothetical protein
VERESERGNKRTNKQSGKQTNKFVSSHTGVPQSGNRLLIPSKSLFSYILPPFSSTHPHRLNTVWVHGTSHLCWPPCTTSPHASQRCTPDIHTMCQRRCHVFHHTCHIPRHPPSATYAQHTRHPSNALPRMPAPGPHTRHVPCTHVGTGWS